MGVMLYEMLTGTKPFPSALNEETLEKIKKGRYVNPRKIDRSIPKVICRMIKKMLKANPDRRFQSIESVIKILKKYLSHYDTHKIRIALAQTVLTKRQFAIPAFERKSERGKKITAGIILCVLFCSLCGWVWNKGFVHKTVLSHWYKSVVLNMTLPSTSSAASDLPVRAFFFVDDGKDIPEVNNSRRVFTQKKSETYETYPVYLRPGKYRIKIAVGPYIMWQTLEVKNEKINLNIKNLEKAARPIKVHAQSCDLESGKDLTKSTKFYLSYRGKWVLLDEIPAGELKTGTVYKILARSNGYEDAFYSLILDWYQDELFLTAGLERSVK